MRFSENRRIAWIVLLACVLGSIVLLGAGSLSSERKALVKTFTNGTDSSSPTRYSMDAFLDKCTDSAQLLAESARVYLNDETTINAVLGQAKALDATNGPDGRYAVYKDLVASVNSLYTELDKAGKTEETDVLLSYGDFKGACDRLERDEDYRKLAQEFNEDLGSFPANVIGGILGIKQLDTFGW